MTHATDTQIDAQTLRNRQTNSEHNKKKKKSQTQITKTLHKNLFVYFLFLCVLFYRPSIGERQTT